MSRVLVIDDSPMLVELTVRALSAAGYHATGATDLASLDQKLTEGPFALILMDVNMPEMFGDDVVEYLRTQKRVTSKLVLYSDISEEELAAKTRNSGADAYILKGGGIEAVIGGIMRILGAPLLERFEGRILNTHPALLPSFPGAHGVRDALAHGVKVTGCTVHLVDAGVDTGPILAQAAVPVLDTDTEAELHERIKVQERALLLRVLGELSRR